MEYFDLRSVKDKQEEELAFRIGNGEIDADNFDQLLEHEQEAVKHLLFKTYSSQINIYKSLSALEYILFSHMRISDREIQGFALSKEDQAIKKSLNPIKEMHDLTNRNISAEEWDLDYLKYLQQQSVDVIRNRAEYKETKKTTYND